MKRAEHYNIAPIVRRFTRILNELHVLQDIWQDARRICSYIYVRLATIIALNIDF